MGVARDHAFARHAIGAPLDVDGALHAKLGDGLVDVAASFLERRLALQHAGAGPAPDFLNVLDIDREHGKILMVSLA
jgi:hypothetical protein